MARTTPAGASVDETPVPTTIDEIMEEMSAIAGHADARTLTADEATRYERLESAAAAIRRSQAIRARQAAYETPVPGTVAGVGAAVPGDRPRNPLAYGAEVLDALQAALSARTSGRFPARGDRELFNAALTTGTFGAPREWGANVLGGPRLLHVVGGVPTQAIEAILAQFPQLTLPTATAGVAEGVTLAEYAASAAGSVTLARFGRFTDFTLESLIGADAASIVAMHQIGIAKDLDKALIDLVNTAAGAAVGFTADVPAAIRKALAQVIDNTAAADGTELVILCHPDNVALLQDVNPVGGRTIAEEFTRFSGALVYPSSAVPTGFMLPANLAAGARYFEAYGVRTETDDNIKTGVQTAATHVGAGYGVTLTAGFVVKVDVVTP
ncbi:MAG TPA: hypothetical protein VFC00_18010 [Micromonosporaceae bacterium]|nr:hypothetical protein [Micromonosporaceae bacterium]